TGLDRVRDWVLVAWRPPALKKNNLAVDQDLLHTRLSTFPVMLVHWCCSRTRLRSRLAVSRKIFFFKAEDGIRDHCVTGVQTCALPICATGGYGDSVPGSTASGPWNTSLGAGVRIAILDSGVDANHPDISPHLALHLSEINQSVLPSPCDDGSPQDQSGHGTWTASLAAGALGPGTGNVIGVAPRAT